jgi:hypothetical protein
MASLVLIVKKVQKCIFLGPSRIMLPIMVLNTKKKHVRLFFSLSDLCRDPNFNLNDFLRSLRVELKSWRKVFWRLWGICHSLYCSLCSNNFPVYMHEFCSFHPQDPDFPTIQFKNSTQPFGAFTCCQMSIYRFQPLPANHKVLKV